MDLLRTFEGRDEGSSLIHSGDPNREVSLESVAHLLSAVADVYSTSCVRCRIKNSRHSFETVVMTAAAVLVDTARIDQCIPG